MRVRGWLVSLVLFSAACEVAGDAADAGVFTVTQASHESIPDAAPPVGEAVAYRVVRPDGLRFMGALVAPRLVLTARWPVDGLAPGAIFFEEPWKVPSEIIFHPTEEAALIRLTADSPRVVEPMVPPDGLEPFQTLRCYRGFQQIEVETLWGDNAFTFTTDIGQGVQLFDGTLDAGVPCFSLGKKLAGINVEVADGLSTQLRVSAFSQWLGDQRHLEGVRQGQTPIALFYVDGAGKRRCLDARWTTAADGDTIDARACDGGLRQTWYLEPRRLTGVRIVSGKSGKCVDLEQAWDKPGTRLVQRSCNTGGSQRWAAVPWPAPRAATLENLGFGGCLVVNPKGGQAEMQPCGSTNLPRFWTSWANPSPASHP